MSWIRECGACRLSARTIRCIRFHFSSNCATSRLAIYPVIYSYWTTLWGRVVLGKRDCAIICTIQITLLTRRLSAVSYKCESLLQYSIPYTSTELLFVADLYSPWRCHGQTIECRRVIVLESSMRWQVRRSAELRLRRSVHPRPGIRRNFNPHVFPLFDLQPHCWVRRI